MRRLYVGSIIFTNNETDDRAEGDQLQPGHYKQSILVSKDLDWYL
jgi:hypothetical protein